MDNYGASQQSETLHFLDYWRVIRTRKEIVLAVTLLVVLTGTAYTFTLPRMYRASAKVQLRGDQADISAFGPAQEGFVYNPFYLRTQFEIIQSKPIMNRVVDNLKLREEWGAKLNSDGRPISKGAAAGMVSRAVRVNQFQDTSIIAISVTRDNPEEAALIANEVAAVYREFRLQQKEREIERGIEALQNELQKQKERVNRAEERVEQIRAEFGITQVGQGAMLDKMSLTQLENNRISARVDMLTRKARLDKLISLEGEELINAAAYMVNDATLQALRSRYMDTQLSLSLMLEDYGENHPEVRRVRSGLAETREKLDEAILGLRAGLQTDYEVARTRYETLENELSLAKQSDIEIERDKLVPFNKAERELSIERSILGALQARVVQEGIQKEVPRTPVDIIEPAEAPSLANPVSPNILMNIILSLVLGLGAGVGLAYFIEYLDTSIKTVNDVEKALGLPVIGVIPQKVRPLINESGETAYAESYRVLRTNLMFANKGHSGGAYAVCSGGVGEGKSTTVSNLAYVFAQMGDKVLIVDADLRRPVQHTILGLSNRFGLTNLLMRDVPIEETIKPTKVPNLHFLPSGRLPRSSVGILESQRMRELIKSLKARYDYIFFDTPPVVGISDASILAGEVDGVLLVVQYRKYPRMISSRARQMIENVGGRISGVVLNNINIMRDDYYYYYHSYYSNYYYRGGDEGTASAKQDQLPAGQSA